MTDDSIRPTSSGAASEAAAWHVRLESARATEQDWHAFEAWLQQDANKAAYEALERALAVVDAHPGAIAALAASSPPPARSLLGRPTIWIASAFALAAALAFAIYLPAVSPRTVYEAQAAADRVVVLPDATEVHLNRGAAVIVADNGRRVVLDRGEAAFKVTHDSARPFTVVVEGVVLRDVGTEFNVARGDRGFVVTVRDGEVELLNGQRSAARLSAGMQARVANDGGATIEHVNADDAFAWQTGRLVYRDALLSTVIEDLNRYSSRSISIGDTRAGEMHFSGVLAIDDADAMLQTLQRFLPIEATQDGERIVVRSRQ